MKSHESLARKILGDMRGSGLSLQEAASQINDALWFTITYPDETLTTSVGTALDRLRHQGYEVLEEKNSWVVGNPTRGSTSS